jgi:hypothetical protein
VSEPGVESRSILNAVASVRAGQEQMQKDVDQVRAGINAMIVFSVYGVAIAVLAFAMIKKGSAAK